MTAPNTAGDSGSESLESFVGDAFGDLDNSSSEPTVAPQGTPPAPVVTTPDPSAGTASTDGAKPDAHAGAPQAAAAVTTPDPNAPVAEPDLLASAKSATYTVDGVEKTYDGIKILGEDGAIIAAADLPDLLTRLGERDRLVGVNQHQYQSAKAIEPLTTWTQTGSDGKVQTLTGPQGLVELHVDRARQGAILDALEEVMTDPAQLLDLLAKNAAGEIVVDPKAWKMMLLQAKDRASDAMSAKRSELGTVQAEAAKPVPQPINYAAEAPAIIKAAAGTGLSLLTPEDHAFLASQLEAYTRGTTVHANYAALVQDRIAQRQTMAKTGAAVTSAAAQNSARLAAAAHGKPAAPVAAIAAVAPASLKTTRASDSDAAWDLMQGLAGKRLRTG